MDTEMIEVLIKQLEQSSLHELELTLGNDSLHLVKASAAPAPIVNTQATVPSQPVTAETAVPAEPEAPTGTAIKAPLVGIVYLSPKPDADPYFEVGAHVNKDDVVFQLFGAHGQLFVACRLAEKHRQRHTQGD